MNFELARTYILDRLINESSKTFYYHNIDHTHDVLEAVARIGKAEELNGNELVLIKTAAAFHDAGMLKTYMLHEEASVEIAEEVLPQFGYSPDNIRAISDMIMATKLPQGASTRMEKILCDADLDYLGRHDFFMISHRLRQEWYEMGINDTSLKEWYQGQVIFLESHTYFTRTAIETRQEGKEKNLKQIKDLLKCD